MAIVLSSFQEQVLGFKLPLTCKAVSSEIATIVSLQCVGNAIKCSLNGKHLIRVRIM